MYGLPKCIATGYRLKAKREEFLIGLKSCHIGRLSVILFSDFLLLFAMDSGKITIAAIFFSWWISFLGRQPEMHQRLG